MGRHGSAFPAALAACASGEAESVAQNPLPGLKERGVNFATADGTLDGFFVQPESGNHPAVILWPDIASIREAKRNIARKLAQAGYAVLRAPADGVIAQRLAEAGQVVSPGQAVYVLAEDGGREVAISLPEQVAADFPPGPPWMPGCLRKAP